jgi:hypothetical protein
MTAGEQVVRESTKKAYAPPKLIVHGTVEKITLKAGGLTDGTSPNKKS